MNCAERLVSLFGSQAEVARQLRLDRAVVSNWVKSGYVPARWAMEVEQLTGELGAILDAVSKVSELDLADVPPTSHPLDLVNAWAEDEPHDSLPLEDVLHNAPAAERDMFRVPPTT